MIKMEKYKWIIRDSEAGNKIDCFATLEEAKRTLEEYEKQDKIDGIYEPNFYEIYNVEKEEIYDE